MGEEGDGDEVEEEGAVVKSQMNAMKLCQESSGLMSVLSTLRSTIPVRRGVDWKESKDGEEEEVGISRGREWGQMAPLTLGVVGEALRDQHPQLPPVTHANAREICAHVPSLSLQFRVIGLFLLPPLTHAHAREICAHVPSLSLQFRGLGSLELVWLLERLTRLEVSNNCLTTTQGIDRLPALTWLDLSFNQIKRLSGIGALRRLEVLALHNNQLERLEKGVLQYLSRLQVLTLANNRLTHLSDVWTLRHLASLASLSLANNPVSGHEYPALVLAHLPRLAYLDHRRVTPQDQANALHLHRITALLSVVCLLVVVYSGAWLPQVTARPTGATLRRPRDLYTRASPEPGGTMRAMGRSQVAVVEAEEERLRREDEAEKERQRSREAHALAGVLALDDGSLLTRMFRGDKDMGVLLQLQGAHALMTKYQEHFNAVCKRIFRAGLQHEEQRQTELRLLGTALLEARTRADHHARGCEAHTGRLAEAAALHEKIDTLLNKTSYELLTAEVTLADQIKDVVARAREELGNLVGGFLEEAAAEFQEGRRLAYTFYCRLRELSTKVADECATVEEQERTARVLRAATPCRQLWQASMTATWLSSMRGKPTSSSTFKAGWVIHCGRSRSEALWHYSRPVMEEWARHRARVEEITTLTARQRQLLGEALPVLHD
ncbi:Dynein regulatory complex subunit 3 [Chionoecetes opilio]|uniref:Dynein axonemal assembly factor 1 homolog n=1 Tax=Chionoecetes opilio TaxID=41210 RepID=A0A8J4XTS2_CHIOP|nr:Dynein regulatory complex subunit 3 [Chionoecetes opilio]